MYTGRNFLICLGIFGPNFRTFFEKITQFSKFQLFYKPKYQKFILLVNKNAMKWPFFGDKTNIFENLYSVRFSKCYRTCLVSSVFTRFGRPLVEILLSLLAETLSSMKAKQII